MKKQISTTNAPAAAGPYSQAVSAGGFVFVSGQLPINNAAKDMVTDDIKEAVKHCMLNVKAILEEAGSGLEKIVKTTVFLSDINNFAAANEAYAEFFNIPGVPAPARSCFQTANLPRGAIVEIEAIALA